MKKSKRIRDYTWEDYGISYFRRKELESFCMQYNEKKSKILYGLKASTSDGMPKRRVNNSPVESVAIENTMYKMDCLLIEKAAIAANPGIWKYILKSVTNDLPYETIEYDKDWGKIIMGKTDFYGYRRLFYRNLHLLKSGDKLTEVP